MRPKIVITMGDAAGIGPEIIFKSLNSKRIYNRCKPVVLGDYKVMKKTLDFVGIDLNLNKVDKLKDCKFSFGTVDIIDLDNINSPELNFGINNPVYGKAAVEYTIEAIKMCMDNYVDAIVSAPLNKKSMHMAGFNFEGQTEILAKYTKTEYYAMILILENIKLMMLSNHISLRNAVEYVKEGKIYNLIILAHNTLKNLGITNPVIAVAGLNPHASEDGLFGSEETIEIAPAIEKAKKEKINVLGPVPPDSIFLKAKEGEYDLVIALYHDQGNIPLKTLGFGKIVTFIAGIPIIRTSVGHGTAFDIAGKNLADETNIVEAIIVASELAISKNKSKN